MSTTHRLACSSMIAAAVVAAMSVARAHPAPAVGAAAPQGWSPHARHKKHRVGRLHGVVITASAPKQAPTRAPLKAVQPTSIIGRQYIENNQAQTANYSDIVGIAPSVVDIEPNGPGLGNSKGLSIRGFQDGQYNLTWDGIPVGDSNDFSHHSAEYFMPQDIGRVSVDRGPGDAAAVGYATFGGTVALHTKQPLDQPLATVYGTYGSFNTRLIGAELDTGVLRNYGDLRAYLDYRQLKSDGALSGATIDRKNVFMKVERDLGENTLLTFVAMYNANSGGNAAIVGATSYPYVAVSQYPYTSSMPGQAQQFGKGYGLSSNPASQAYTGYNYDNFNTDFEYLGLRSVFGNVQVDNKIYTYAYYHRGWNGLDPNGGCLDYGQVSGPSGVTDGTFPAGACTPNGTINGPTNIPGQHMYLNYRNWGDMLRFKQIFGPGELRYGAWFNYQSYHRYQANIDMSDNDGWNALGTYPDGLSKAINRLIDGTFTTVQPYIQYTWNIMPRLQFTPGVKYAYFERHDIAPLEQKTKAPLNYRQSWGKALPSVDLHYAIAKHWAAYLQAAEGYLAPNENLFYVPNPQQSDASIAPESTKNYQIGTTWSSRRLSASVDAYVIDFSNQVAHRKIGSLEFFYNNGGVKYRGAEAEATYYVGEGFSLYGNASYNSAKVDDTGLQVTGVPKETAAAGVIFNNGLWYGSLIGKYVGSNWGDVGADAAGSTINIYPIASNTVVNASLKFTVPGGEVLPKGMKIGVQVFNLFDTRDINSLAGYTGNNVPLFYFIAPRSVMLNVSVPLGGA